MTNASTAKSFRSRTRTTTKTTVSRASRTGSRGPWCFFFFFSAGLDAVVGVGWPGTVVGAGMRFNILLVSQDRSKLHPTKFVPDPAILSSPHPLYPGPVHGLVGSAGPVHRYPS